MFQTFLEHPQNHFRRRMLALTRALPCCFFRFGEAAETEKSQKVVRQHLHDLTCGKGQRGQGPGGGKMLFLEDAGHVSLSPRQKNTQGPPGPHRLALYQ